MAGLMATTELIILIFCGLTKGITVFGFALVSISILSLFLDSKAVVSPILIYGIRFNVF